MKKIFISLILILSVTVIGVFAEDDVLTISGAEVSNGDEFDVVFSISDVPAIVGSVTVSYDNSSIEFVDSEFSKAFSNMSAIINPEYAENQIKFNWLSIDEGIDYKDFLVIKFRAKRPGATEINIVQCSLYDALENPVELRYEAAVIYIEGLQDDAGIGDSEEADKPQKSESSSGVSRPSGGGSTSLISDKVVISPVTDDEEKNVSEEVEVRFSDISEYKWAEGAITELAGKGIIKGISENVFAPDRMIKRADFMCLLVRMVDTDVEIRDNFDDVSADKYYYKEVGIAKVLGITQGVGDNLFLPESNISRQEMFTLVYRFLQVKNISLEEHIDIALTDFADAEAIKDYAVTPISMLVSNNLVSGSNGMILPDKNATRAETAVLIHRLYNYLQR